MAIDILTEETFSLTRAAKLRCLPRRRKGRRPNVATLYRWSTVGVRGIILETVQCAGARCTLREALSRFFAALTQASPTGRQAVIRSPLKRRRAAEKAIQELERQGI